MAKSNYEYFWTIHRHYFLPHVRLPGNIFPHHPLPRGLIVVLVRDLSCPHFPFRYHLMTHSPNNPVVCMVQSFTLKNPKFILWYHDDKRISFHVVTAELDFSIRAAHLNPACPVFTWFHQASECASNLPDMFTNQAGLTIPFFAIKGGMTVDLFLLGGPYGRATTKFRA